MQPTATSNSSDQQQSKPTPPPPQPHWMPAMQYPPPAMVMPHQMHYPPPPPHYMAAAAAAAYLPHPHPYMQSPLHHGGGGGHHHHRNNNNGDASSGENKTLWVGDLHHWMDEQYLHSCFTPSYEIANIKVIRNKQTGFSEGYGFVEFNSHATAEKALQSYGSSMMPNTDQSFRLNWASFSTGDKRSENGSDHSIFVGDLAADVTDSLLLETFANKYPSVKAAKVVIDVNTGRSKGYGFVRFGDDSERTQAMTEMNGVYCSSRPMRTGAATPRKSMGYQQGNFFSSYSHANFIYVDIGLLGGYAGNGGSAQGSQMEGDSTNTTIFVGGLDKDATDDDLRQPFSQYGEIVSVKIPANKNCGFVQFANRSDAEEALDKLNGTTIGKQTVRLSWGRNPSNKQMRNDYGNQWNGGGYYGAPVYDYYGMPHPQDPSMYAAAYGAYPVYGNQQQVS
ncbi:hypothetical protein V2J09_011766 [Rumex salicifolius]